MSRHGLSVRALLCAIMAAFTPPFVVPAAAAQTRDVVLATTTSVRDAGLLDVLLPPFELASGVSVRVLAVGSGQAMELGRRGVADILILHEPDGERRFVDEGFGIDRRPLMHNTFVIVGPPEDPAAIRGRSAVDAFRAIVAYGALFVSRGDRSGTHTRERLLWGLSGVEPAEDMLRETGQGMGASLVIADQFGAYTLSDIGTFLAHKAPLRLEVFVEHDSALVNSYHVIRVNPERFPHVNAEGARLLAEYLLSPETLRAIGEYGVARYGRALFEPARD